MGWNRISFTITLVVFILFIPVFGSYSSVNVSHVRKGGRSPLTNSQIYYSKCTLLNNSRPIEITWTSNWNEIPQTIVNGSTCIGDQIILNVTFPDTNVTQIELQFPGWDPFNSTREIVKYPLTNETPFFDLDSCDVQVLPEVLVGDFIELHANFTNTNCDYMVFWLEDYPWALSESIVHFQMCTRNYIEYSNFTVQRSGALAVVCFNMENEPGFWNLYAENHGSRYSNLGNSFVFDTTSMMRNFTRNMEIIGNAEDNSSYSSVLTNITFENFFPPKLLTATVTGATAVKTVIWTHNDLNADDKHYFEVKLSNDGGVTYQLLTKNITSSYYEWDSSEKHCLERSTYRFKILVFDEQGLSDEIETAAFAAGVVIPLAILPRWALSHPQDVISYELTSRVKVVWDVLFYPGYPSGRHESWYTITINGTSECEGEILENDNNISLDINHLPIGVHVIRVALRQTPSTEWVRDFVVVTILPVWDHPKIDQSLASVVLSYIMDAFIVIVSLMIIHNLSKWVVLSERRK